MSSFVGFESLFDEIERMSSMKQSTYPAYDIKKLSNNSFIIVLALAGFSKKEIHVYTEYGRLIVEGKKEEKEGQSEYVHKGLAKRSFSRAWALSEDIEVREVQFKDGLLTVKLGKVVPDHHARKDYLK